MAFLACRKNSEREETVFSLILGRIDLRGFCLFIMREEIDYRQKNPLKDNLIPLSQVLNHEEMNIC
jgi:hypothetical protein